MWWGTLRDGNRQDFEASEACATMIALSPGRTKIWETFNKLANSNVSFYPTQGIAHANMFTNSKGDLRVRLPADIYFFRVFEFFRIAVCCSNTGM